MGIEHWSDRIILVNLQVEPTFSEDIEALIGELSNHARDVVLNFEKVDYINSSNMAEMLQVRDALKGSDCRLILCHVNKTIFGALHTTGLDRVFNFQPDLPSALAAMQLDEQDR